MPKKTFDPIADAPKDAFGDDKEPISGSTLIPATMHDIKKASAAFDVSLKKSKKSTESRTILLFVIGVVGSLGTGFLSVRAIAQDAGTDAMSGVKTTVEIVKVKHDLLAAEVARHVAEEAKHRERVESKLDRQDVNQQLVLDALNVPKWRRPPPVDGGF